MARLYFRAGQDARIAATFARESQRTNHRALRHMRRVSRLVMDQSVRNSPVDWKGYTSKEPPGQELERSHRIEEQYGSRGRIEATVVVGGMVGDVDVDLYAEWIHEGSYNLGPASRRKAASSPKNKVGPQFLERALQDHEDEFEPLLDELLEGLLG